MSTCVASSIHQLKRLRWFMDNNLLNNSLVQKYMIIVNCKRCQNVCAWAEEKSRKISSKLNFNSMKLFGKSYHIPYFLYSINRQTLHASCCRKPLALRTSKNFTYHFMKAFWLAWKMTFLPTLILVRLSWEKHKNLIKKIFIFSSPE